MPDPSRRERFHMCQAHHAIEQLARFDSAVLEADILGPIRLVPAPVGNHQLVVRGAKQNPAHEARAINSHPPDLRGIRIEGGRFAAKPILIAFLLSALDQGQQEGDI